MFGRQGVWLEGMQGWVKDAAGWLLGVELWCPLVSQHLPRAHAPTLLHARRPGAK